MSPVPALHAVATVLALALAVATAHAMGATIGSYDEGIVLTGADLMLRGQVPYRDFYSNYPPGIFLVVAGLWKVFGVHAIVVRVIGLAAHLAIALAGARLAGRIVGRRAVPLAAALVLNCLLPARAAPYAYLVALALLLISVELVLWARDGGATAHRRWLAAGVAFGAVGCFRHDLLVYAAAVAVPLVAAGAWWGGRVRDRAVQRAAGVFVLGALVPLVMLWLPTFARAGIRQPFLDLYLDQVRYVLPARQLPLPRSLGLSPEAGWLSFIQLPGRLPTAVLLSLAAVPCAVLAWAFARKWRLDRMTVVAVGACACAVLPQMLGRTDTYHAVYATAPGIVLGCALLDRIAARWHPVAWGLAAFVFLDAVAWARSPEARWPTFATAEVLPRAAPLPSQDAEARRRVVDFVARNSRPDQALYVGCADHRRLVLNDVDLYFLANRRGATRIMQFDPGMVTRDDEQRAMIADLEKQRPPVAVLATTCWWPEANRSQEMGAATLDAYLRQHYAEALTTGPFRVLTRR